MLDQAMPEAVQLHGPRGGRPGSGAVKRKLADQGPLPRPAAAFAFPKRRDDDWDVPLLAA